MKWTPWDDFDKDPEVLPITEPPCPYCVHWLPQRIYAGANTGQYFAGVRLCHSVNMAQDFSCFQERTDDKSKPQDT